MNDDEIITPEQLTPAERKWAENYAEGVAKLLALGGFFETPEEYRKEVETIKRIALEPGSYIYKLARRWRQKTLEAFLGK